MVSCLGRDEASLIMNKEVLLKFLPKITSIGDRPKTFQRRWQSVLL
jgi:hypothetical protein